MHNEAHIDGRELQPRAERWHPSSASLLASSVLADFALGTTVSGRGRPFSESRREANFLEINTYSICRGRTNRQYRGTRTRTRAFTKREGRVGGDGRRRSRDRA